jgi:hypothetical protein
MTVDEAVSLVASSKWLEANVDLRLELENQVVLNRVAMVLSDDEKLGRAAGMLRALTIGVMIGIQMEKHVP